MDCVVFFLKVKLIPDRYLCHSPLMIACEEDRENIAKLLIENGASVALKNKVGLLSLQYSYSVCAGIGLGSNYMYNEEVLQSYGSIYYFFQNGLTAVHIACKNGRRGILCSLLEKAKTQKNFCFKRSLPSDYDVVMSAKAREVSLINLIIICMNARCSL